MNAHQARAIIAQQRNEEPLFLGEQYVSPKYSGKQGGSMSDASITAVYVLVPVAAAVAGAHLYKKRPGVGAGLGVLAALVVGAYAIGGSGL